MTEDELRVALESDPSSSDAEERVALSISGRIATVTLVAPAAHNVLRLAGWRRLARIFQHDLPVEEAVRAVIVRGAGKRAFSAGADITEFPSARMTPEDAHRYNAVLSRALLAVADYERPVIAMLRGVVVGGGCELAAACDLRIASAEASFGVPIGRIGVTLGYVEAKLLTQLVGPSRVKELVFSGRLIDSAEAFRIGLVDRVISETELTAETAELVSHICAAAPMTLRATKVVTAMCSRGLQPGDTDKLAQLTFDAYGSRDLREGVSAFTEGRRPMFEGR